MNEVTKRVPRQADGNQLERMVEMAQAMGLGVDPAELRSVVANIYATGVGAAPIDPLEAALERTWAELQGRAAT